MYTQCPECLTIYEIDEDALQASLGIVRCGRCAKRFDALRTLSNSLPFVPLGKSDPAEHAPTLTDVVPPAALEATTWQGSSGAPAAPGPDPGHAALPGASEPAAAAPADRTTGVEDSADDWFAAIESELNAAASTTAVAAPSDAGAGDAREWSVELPDAAHDPTGTWPGPVGATGGNDDAPLEAQTDASPATDAPARDDTVALADTGAAVDTAPGQWVDEVEVDAGADGLGAGTTDSTSGDVGKAPVDEPDADAATESAPNDDASDNPALPSPVYVPPRGPRISRAGMAWATGCGLLALVLAAQLAWAHRVDLFRDPATRPWVARACETIPCGLPPIKDIAKLELLSRDVRPDPGVAGALMITATVRNNATFRQPWPVVVVELDDLDNHPVAMRRFRPAEYMPDATRQAAGIAPGATAVLAFEVADPGKSAVAFQFAFQ